MMKNSMIMGAFALMALSLWPATTAWANEGGRVIVTFKAGVSQSEVQAFVQREKETGWVQGMSPAVSERGVTLKLAKDRFIYEAIRKYERDPLVDWVGTFAGDEHWEYLLRIQSLGARDPQSSPFEDLSQYYVPGEGFRGRSLFCVWPPRPAKGNDSPFIIQTEDEYRALDPYRVSFSWCHDHVRPDIDMTRTTILGKHIATTDGCRVEFQNSYFRNDAEKRVSYRIRTVRRDRCHDELREGVSWIAVPKVPADYSIDIQANSE